MKLVLLTAFLIKHTVIANEQYPFPPQFHKPNPGIFGSDSSIFLPPESHTPIPYFPMKNVNSLQFPYLPPTGTKAPSSYPSPFPVILSSTLVPIFDDDDDDDNENNNNHIKNNNMRISSPMPPKLPPRQNNTENGPRAHQPANREMRSPPKMGNYHNPNERIDMKFPPQFSMGPTTPNPSYQTQRNMIIDTHRNDFGFDQIKAASIQNPHYVAAPGYTISSTEPAIPIIRLSNEMDLDGSFSYEALGADQTHYVQHSHMENMGTDKQEQVVEGSYSYVGDNGQTYTVHYVADSNGFRASGDHLPVAPPIPEIIQRAVQYNLAEEAKKPPHLRNWQDEEKDYDSSDRGAPFILSPSRNLFTGRTPEAFSYGFSQGNNNENNLVAAPSSQVPIKTNTEYIIDQTKSKQNNGPISPQITFLASQGAHVPSMNQPNPQQSISRIFNNEKPAMPQLVNYDVGNKEAEQEANKGLWRWQYGLNSNNPSQAPEKNTISRSFGEGDDIMINFGEMTQDQYTKMLQSQLEPKRENSASPQFYQTPSINHNSETKINNAPKFENMNEFQNQNYPQMNYYSSNNNIMQHKPTMPPQTTSTSTLSYSSSPTAQTERSYTSSPDLSYSNNQKTYESTHQPISKSQDDIEIPYDFKRIKALRVESTTKQNFHNLNVIPISNNNNHNKLYYNMWTKKNAVDDEPNTITQVPAFYSTVSAPKLLDVHEYRNEFKPVFNSVEEKQESTTVLTESTTENMLKTNFFLKALLQPMRTDSENTSKRLTEEPKKEVQNKNIVEQKGTVPNLIPAETKTDKIHKLVPSYTKSHHEVKGSKRKPLDLSDVINYMTNKNMFESSKIKAKSNTMNYHSHEQSNHLNMEPWHENRMEEYENNEKEREYKQLQQNNNIRNLNSQEHEELRGLIKNYKVLQRNHNAKNYEHNHIHKEVTPPSVRLVQSAGLPPLGRAGPSMKTYLPPIYV